MAKLTVRPHPWGAHYRFYCPGCKESHVFEVCNDGSGWSFDGDLERPTFSPSLLVRSGHYAPGHKGHWCWCTYNAEHPDDPSPFVCRICHSFVRGGRIEFLSDCTHDLAGQTVDLPETR